MDYNTNWSIRMTSTLRKAMQSRAKRARDLKLVNSYSIQEAAKQVKDSRETIKLRSA